MEMTISAILFSRSLFLSLSLFLVYSLLYLVLILSLSTSINRCNNEGLSQITLSTKTLRWSKNTNNDKNNDRDDVRNEGFLSLSIKDTHEAYMVLWQFSRGRTFLHGNSLCRRDACARRIVTFDTITLQYTR
jgi:hypothetical protein